MTNATNGAVTIIDYRAGNLASVARALDHLGARWEITADPAAVERAERVIFPGVGAAGAAMENLRARGLCAPVRAVVAAGRPFLGICLGAQILFSHSEEDDAECLDIVRGNVLPFARDMRAGGERLKVPHMGWNTVKVVRPHPVLAGVAPEDRFYFVHAYRVAPADESVVLGATDYGVVFPSIIGRGSLVACQFHPEKSGEPGLGLLARFLAWDGGAGAR